MGTGIVKWFNDRKGYGFIIPDEGKEDLFVHHSSIIAEGYRSLDEGQKVEFDTVPGKNGIEAIEVKELAGDGNIADVVEDLV